MAGVRLRTKFLLSLIVTTAALSSATLLIVQYYLSRHARDQIHDQISSSFLTFQDFSQQRQRLLLQSAAVSADLPNIKALMTTDHEATIQDASYDFWQLAESDLFLLANPAGRVMALHTTTADLGREEAWAALTQTLARERTRDWWFAGGRLFEVFMRPIYFGTPFDNSLLGVLVTGYAVNEQLSAVAARITSSDVAFRYGGEVVASTLSPHQQMELSGVAHPPVEGSAVESVDLRLGDENFVAASRVLAPTGGPPVTLTLLKSYDAATLFLQNLNRMLVGVGLVAVLAGSGLMFLISHTFTRPLVTLASGVRALEKGNFTFPLNFRSNDELGELTIAFERMRKTLRESQQHLLHAERLATVGRMASTISHDLRHPLTTILAYAEILADSDLDEAQRQELYEEIRTFVNNMAELIASLLEFSKAQEALQVVHGDLVRTLEHTMNAVRLRPEFRQIRLKLAHSGSTEGWFDFNKLDRVFYNLLLNAGEAAPSDSGEIAVDVLGLNDRIEISISDNGSGIPESIRSEIFQPFVTYGKTDGTGLGLAVADKVVRDHGGDLRVESTGPHGTTFKITLPAGRADETSRS
jgi:signal transduction histidine kinase